MFSCKQARVLLFLVLCCCVLCARVLCREVYVGGAQDSGSCANCGTVVLGGLFPVHKFEDDECSRVLDLGFQRQEAMVYAVQKVNADPSLLPAVALAFAIRDTCSDSNVALKESLEYVNTVAKTNQSAYSISGIVGAASSDVSITVANLVQLFNLPQISYASTARQLSDKTRFRYFLRTVPPDLLQANAMADIVHYFNWSYVIAISSDDAYGMEGIDAFMDHLVIEEDNSSSVICIAKWVRLGLRATEEDFDTAIDAISGEFVANASVIVMFAQLATAEGVLDAVDRRRKHDPDFAERVLIWIGSDAWGDQVSSRHRAIAKDILSITPKYKESQGFNDYFTSLSPINNAANPWLNDYWELFFNCSFQEQGGKEMCSSLSKISPSTGIGYKQNSKVSFTIDAVYAFAHALHNMISELCGSENLCKAVLNSDNRAVNGELLLGYLYNVSFAGESTDVIQFDENGDELGVYGIKTMQQAADTSRFFFESVGEWKKNTLVLNHFSWNQLQHVLSSICSEPCGGGEYPEPVAGQESCCWVCKPCPSAREVSEGVTCRECDLGYIPDTNHTICELIPLTYLSWNNSLAIVIFLFVLVGIAATSAVAIIFLIYRNDKLIKASSRDLSIVLLFGIFSCYLLTIFYLVKPSAPICAIRRVSIGLSFTVCYAALFIKLVRIYRIFNQAVVKTTPPSCIDPKSQLLLTACASSIQIPIAIIWLVIERPGVQYIYTDTTAELACSESPYTNVPVALAYSFLLLVLNFVLAFKIRKVPQNFNESGQIFVAVILVGSIWIFSLPSYFATVAVHVGTVYQTFSLVISILLSTSTTLCCLFGPRIYFLFSKRNKEYDFSRQEGYSLSIHKERHLGVGMYNYIASFVYYIFTLVIYTSFPHL